MDWLTVDDYKEWARINAPDTLDDPAISRSVDAIGPQRISDVLAWPLTQTATCWTLTGDVFEGALLWVNRLMARRNSPDGVVGVSDLGTAIIRSYDADIRSMLGPALNTVLA